MGRNNDHVLLGVVTGFLLLFNLFSCGNQKPGGASDSSDLKKNSIPSMKEIDEKAYNETIDLKVGDTLRLQLESSPTTGYRWHIAEYDETAIHIIKDEFRSSTPPSDTDSAGGGGKRIIVIKAEKIGDYDFQLHYFRVWEGKEKALREFAVTLHVE